MQQDAHTYFSEVKRRRRDAIANFNKHFQMKITLDTSTRWSLSVRFINTHNEDLFLPIDLGNVMNFGNRRLAREAAYKGVHITDPIGWKLDAEFTLRISTGSTWCEFVAPSVPANDSYECFLLGDIQDDFLVFSTCQYKLVPESLYRLQFRVAGVASNELIWSYPAQPSQREVTTNEYHP